MILLTILCYLFFLIFNIIFIVLFILWFTQSYVLYLPSIGGRSGVKRKLALNPSGLRSPAEHKMTYEEYFLTTTDNVLIHVWFLPHSTQSTSCPSVIFFHGNAGNIGNRIFNALTVQTECVCNVLLVEYRGYGNSTGVPSEVGLQLDSLCALDFLRSNSAIDQKKIFIFGRSLGGAVSIWLANKRPQHIAGLIVENTFTSIKDMAFCLLTNMTGKNIIVDYPKLSSFLSVFLNFFMTSHWRSIDIAPNLTVPTLFLSGLKDELVPPRQMQQLYSALSPNLNKKIHYIGEGTHNDTYLHGGEAYYQTMKDFIHG